MNFDWHYHPSRHSARHIVLWIVAIAFFMENLDSTIVTTAIPHIAFVFHVFPLAMRVTITSYLISVAIFTVFSAWLGDRYGSKRIFIAALIIFTLGSWLCGLSENLNTLIVARILQGAGGGIMIPTARIMVMTSFPRSEITRIMALIALPVLVGPMLGPVVGGIITTYGNWRWIFYINIPVGILGIIATLRYFIELESRAPRRLDVVGFIAAAVGLASLSYFLEIINDASMPLTWKWSLISCAMGAFSFYIWHSQKSPSPLIDLKIFQVRTFRVSWIAQFVFRIGSAGFSFVLPLMLQVEFGLNPFEAGMLFAVLPFGTFLTKSIVQKILQHVGFKKTLMVNTILVSFGIALLYGVREPLQIYYVLMVFFFLGLTTSAQYSSLNSLIMADLSESEVTHGATMMSLTQQIFTSMGIATVALLVEFYDGGLALTPGHLYAFHAAFWTLSGINLCNLFFLFTLRSQDGNMVLHRAGKGEKGFWKLRKK